MSDSLAYWISVVTMLSIHLPKEVCFKP